MFVIRNRILDSAGWLWVCFLAGIYLMVAQPIQADPVARWDFDGEPGKRIIRQGNVQRGQPGPRPPEFPDMAADNTSVRFDGQGSYYSIPDEGANSRFDFTNGDAISIEAWVRLEGSGTGLRYVVGKGRTNAAGFARDNQNWALRLESVRGVARLSFLFASERSRSREHWHRWTSQLGFQTKTGWHHVAIAYRFGQPETMQGWVDGQVTPGVWDLGGATRKLPVVDNDAIWIGSSLGGNPPNSFWGCLDAIAIHRTLLTDKVIASRFCRRGGPQVVGPLPEVMPQVPDVPVGRVVVTFAEGLPAQDRWLNTGEKWPPETARWVGQEFLLPRLPLRYDSWGIRTGWKAPVLVRMAADVQLTPGTHRMLLRGRGLARLWVDGAVVVRTKPIVGAPPNGEELVTPLATPPLPGLRVHGYHQQEVLGSVTVETAQPKRCRVILELVVGGKNHWTATGEVCVAIESADGQTYNVLRPLQLQPSGQSELPLTDLKVAPVLDKIEASLSTYDDRTRRQAAASQDAFWRRRHKLAQAVVSIDSAPTQTIDEFIRAKIDRAQANVTVAPLLSDQAFLRRVYLDTVGVPPTVAEVGSYFAIPSPRRRAEVIEQLLGDPRCADHGMSFWLDLLAENPTLINASLNSTGPFRWFLYEALRDNKALDRMVTELVLMRGGRHEGGSAGFAMAAENDAPYAAKAHILSSAFLGIELQCARCHDAPYHSTTQEDLYSVAAMLQRKSVTVPASSRVPASFFEDKSRESLIQVTLKPDQKIVGRWPFAKVTGVVDSPQLDQLLQDTTDSRERLAALITTADNKRFAAVIVNRLWKQLMGAGLVEPVHDWEGAQPSHPDLLAWLARQLVMHDYDLRTIRHLILSSRVYQSEATGQNALADPKQRWFHAPDSRRLTAEQIVDSMYVTTGTRMDVEELTFVHDGRRDIGNRLTLGRPTHAWMFASLNNERDRPSLSLPRARAVADVLEAFGWTGSRQNPVVARDNAPSILQSGILANGTLAMKVTRAAHRSTLAQLAVEAESVEALVRLIFLRMLSRQPQDDELAVFTSALQAGFEDRLVPVEEIKQPPVLPALRQVTWFNHLRPDANKIQQEVERRVRAGPPPDPRLRTAWRESYEDLVWSLLNHAEFVWVP